MKSVLWTTRIDTWRQKNWNQLNKDMNRIYNRNMKVVKSIAEAENMQMVLADFGLTSF